MYSTLRRDRFGVGKPEAWGTSSIRTGQARLAVIGQGPCSSTAGWQPVLQASRPQRRRAGRSGTKACKFRLVRLVLEADSPSSRGLSDRLRKGSRGKPCRGSYARTWLCPSFLRRSSPWPPAGSGRALEKRVAAARVESSFPPTAAVLGRMGKNATFGSGRSMMTGLGRPGWWQPGRWGHCPPEDRARLRARAVDGP